MFGPHSRHVPNPKWWLKERAVGSYQLLPQYCAFVHHIIANLRYAKHENSLLVNVDIPIDTKRLVRISLHPPKTDLNKKPRKDPLFYSWVNPRTFDWAMASIAFCMFKSGFWCNHRFHMACFHSLLFNHNTRLARLARLASPLHRALEWTKGRAPGAYWRHGQWLIYVWLKFMIYDILW